MGLSFSVGQYLLIDPFSGSAENATINDMLQIIMSKYAGRYGNVSLRLAVTAICDKFEAESRPTPVVADRRSSAGYASDWTAVAPVGGGG